MTELRLYKCDRCKQEYKLEANSEPESITVDAFGEATTYQLCDNCIATVHIMISKFKEFDVLAEKLYAEEYN